MAYKKPPTPKQVRYHYQTLLKLRYKFRIALHGAHNAGVIDYPDDKYKEEGPCYSFNECWNRVEKTTEKQLAQAMRDELRKAAKV